MSGPLEYCQRLCCWITGPAHAVNRNITHRRVVTNDNNERPLMIFETNGMVFVYNPERPASCGNDRKMSYCFAKQDSKYTLQEEDFLRKFNTWRPIQKCFIYILVQTDEKALKYALHVQLVNYRYSQKLSPFESVFLTQMLGYLILPPFQPPLSPSSHIQPPAYLYCVCRLKERH